MVCVAGSVKSPMTVDFALRLCERRRASAGSRRGRVLIGKDNGISLV